MRRNAIAPQFVTFIPDKLAEGILYVSEQHATAIHKCCCGCGTEVVTPLSPADWQLYKERGTVTLYPSIGNWNLPCHSHYWIRRNRVDWAPSMTAEQIRRVQLRDRRDKQRWVAKMNSERRRKDVASIDNLRPWLVRRLWQWLLNRFGR
jgi:Family of unknown function (DUF6527)